jgi:hypothetical protein
MGQEEGQRKKASSCKGLRRQMCVLESPHGLYSESSEPEACCIGVN